jgi:type IV pilus assembly protein PilA
MSDAWYYADRQHQQRGPVQAAELARLHQAGEITAASLVWCEGMPGWAPLSQVAAELGLTLPAGPPPMQAAPRPTIAKSSSSGGGCLVAAIVGGFALLVVGGVFLAIAIPAYSDYTIRARVNEERARATALKLAVAEYVAEHERCPKNGDGSIGTAESYANDKVSAIRVGQLEKNGACTIQLLFKDLGSPDTAGAELLMEYDGRGRWHESSTLPARYLPLSLRQGQR